jgi:hypothetical protein
VFYRNTLLIILIFGDGSRVSALAYAVLHCVLGPTLPSSDANHLFIIAPACRCPGEEVLGSLDLKFPSCAYFEVLVLEIKLVRRKFLYGYLIYLLLVLDVRGHILFSSYIRLTALVSFLNMQGIPWKI